MISTIHINIIFHKTFQLHTHINMFFIDIYIILNLIMNIFANIHMKISIMLSIHIDKIRICYMYANVHTHVLKLFV